MFYIYKYIYKYNKKTRITKPTKQQGRVYPSALSEDSLLWYGKTEESSLYFLRINIEKAIMQGKKKSVADGFPWQCCFLVLLHNLTSQFSESECVRACAPCTCVREGVAPSGID